MKEIKVIKASGEREPFSQKKLENSLRKAGVLDNALTRWITNEIKNKIKGEVSTSQIYNQVFNSLSKKSLTLALRYRLKQAIMELGPSGHPFEKFLAQILKNLGYETKTNVIMRGKCVLHEIDVLAEKNGKKIIIEAKYHNERGIKTDVKVAMYVKERFNDIKLREKIDEVWLITNTKLTSDAKQYAACVGMKAIAWDYPENESLQKIIEDNNLYPITILNSLNLQHKKILLQKGVFLIKDIRPYHLTSLHLSKKSQERVKKEITSLLIF
jgi:Holliday junction resolvase-like predicted endonuclease